MESNSKRTYQQFCGLARALDVVGERWTLLLVRNLLLGPQRYSELMRGLPGITTNLLAKRLKALEKADVIERIRFSATDPREAYRLTPRGLALEPAVHALGAWGTQSMQGGPREDEHRRIDWFLLSLKRRYRGGETLRAELLIDQAPYFIDLAEAAMEVGRGPARQPELVIRGANTAVIDWIRTGESDEVDVEGEGEVVQRFQAAFAR